MKSIKFTDQELEFLRTQYQLELIEAEKYVQEVKNLLVKLGVKPATTELVPEKKTKRGRKKSGTPKETPVKKGKRGRKPKVTTLPEVKEPKVEKQEKMVKVERKPKSKIAKSRPVKKSEPLQVVDKVQDIPMKKSPPKPKTKRKTFARRGIVLKSLSKPLPKKDVLPESVTKPVEPPTV